MPNAIKFTAMCKAPRAGVFADRPMEMLLPHEMFAALFHAHPEHWKKTACSSPDKLEQLWADVSDHPALDGNPVKDSPAWERRTAPISIHGDGVPIKGVGKSWSESMNICSWCSMIAGHGSTLEYNFFIHSIFNILFRIQTCARLWQHFGR
eukprot:14967-Pyramimonas_sp.AAC.1